MSKRGQVDCEVGPLYAVHAIEAHARWGIAPLTLLGSSVDPDMQGIFLIAFVRSVTCDEGVSEDVAPSTPQHT